MSTEAEKNSKYSMFLSVTNAILSDTDSITQGQ